MFVLLPTFDQATAGIITIYMTCSIPWLLGEILNPDNRWSNNKKRWIIYIIPTIVLFLASVSIFTRYIYVTPSAAPSGLRSLPLVIVVLIPFFLSVGFWENLSGIYFELLQKRNAVMSCISGLKLIITILSFLLIYGAFGGLRTLFPSGPSPTTLALLERDIRLFNTLPFGGDCSSGHPFLIATINILSSYVCYKSSYYTCRTALQWQSFSLPLVSSIILVPVFVGLYLEPDTFYTKCQNCSIISEDWDFNIEQGNNANQGLLIAFYVITIICFLLMTPYIWREGVKIELVEK